MNPLKGKRTNLKPHPLSAVEKSTKLSNNLYSIVNNKLVRNNPLSNASGGGLTDNETSSNQDYYAPFSQK